MSQSSKTIPFHEAMKLLSEGVSLQWKYSETIFSWTDFPTDETVHDQKSFGRLRSGVWRVKPNPPREWEVIINFKGRVVDMADARPMAGDEVIRVREVIE